MINQLLTDQSSVFITLIGSLFPKLNKAPEKKTVVRQQFMQKWVCESNTPSGGIDF